MAKKKAPESTAVDSEAGRLAIQYLPVMRLKEDPSNARKHGDRNLDAIEASLRRFGQRKPIVVDRDDVVIAGNGTLLAARRLGWAEIAVVRADDMGPAEITAFAIADNRTAELAEWDDAVLRKHLDALEAEGWELPDLGFGDADLAEDEEEGDGPGEAGGAQAAVKVGQHGVIVLCRDEPHQREVYERLVAEGMDCRVVVT